MFRQRRSRTPIRQRAMPRSGRQSGCLNGRLIMALVVAGFALFSYFGSRVYNPVTGEDQYISITQDQEIALGLQSEPQMIQQYGGLHPDQEAQAFIDAIGQHIVDSNPAVRDSGYEFDFHLLDDDQTVNAFALPGGPIFITTALLNRLETEGQVAGVLGHEIGHVVGRHSAERIAKQELTQGLTGAVVMATYDPDNPNSQRTAQVAVLIGQVVNMKYGREDELESDKLGVLFMAEAGYDPRGMVEVMRVLAEASGGGTPEFFSTHPNPENRVERIQAAINEVFPNGVPEGLIQ